MPNGGPFKGINANFHDFSNQKLEENSKILYDMLRVVMNMLFCEPSAHSLMKSTQAWLFWIEFEQKRWGVIVQL